MPKSDSAEIWLGSAIWPIVVGPGIAGRPADIQTEMAISDVTAKASLGEGSKLQKPRRAGSAAMRALSDASNAGEGDIAGRPSSALQRARNSSARERQETPTARRSSTASRSASM